MLGKDGKDRGQVNRLIRIFIWHDGWNNRYLARLAVKELRALATKQICIPGDAGWPLGTLFPAAANKAESGRLTLPPVQLNCHFVWELIFFFFQLNLFRAYFKQAREELSIRLCDQLFNADGTKSKWWQVITPHHRRHRPNHPFS